MHLFQSWGVAGRPSSSWQMRCNVGTLFLEVLTSFLCSERQLTFLGVFVSSIFGQFLSASLCRQPCTVQLCAVQYHIVQYCCVCACVFGFVASFGVRFGVRTRLLSSRNRTDRTLYAAAILLLSAYLTEDFALTSVKFVAEQYEAVNVIESISCWDRMPLNITSCAMVTS